MRLLFRLAVVRGVGVPDLLDSLTAWEWLGWIAYHGLEPFGPRQDDLRAGVVASAAVAAWGARSKPSDWFPTLAEERQDASELRASLLALCPAYTIMSPGGG